MGALLKQPRVSGELSNEMIRLLRHGVADKRGWLLPLRPANVSTRTYDPAVLALINLGLAKWQEFYDAVITDAGRAAIGEPSEEAARRLERIEESKKYRAWREAQAAERRANPPAPKPVVAKERQREPSICLLLDVRGQARPNSIQVWSYSKRKIVSLGRFYTTGARRGLPMAEIVSHGTKRWCAVNVPKWMAAREGLYGRPQKNPNAFCREGMGPDTRSPEQKADDHDQDIAQIAVDAASGYSVPMSGYLDYFEKQLLPRSSS
jgi:hypothetical protein